jgi:hypothetical protein
MTPTSPASGRTTHVISAQQAWTESVLTNEQVSS